MGYEDAISTKLLATTCAICGLPLRDPASVERGVGPECWAKYFMADRPLPAAADADKMRAAMELAPEPLRGRWREVGGDPSDAHAPWATNPETRRKMVSLGLHHAAVAVSYGASAAETVAKGVDTAMLAITAVQNFAAAAGYQKTADRMAKEYGAKLEEQIIAFTRPDPKRPTTLAVHVPPNETWKGIARKNHAIFFQSKWEGGRFFRYFHERDLRKVVNMLQGVFGDAYCFNPDGNLILLPAMPLSEEPPAPSGDAPQPTKVTGVLPTVPSEMDEIKLGDEVTLPDGSTSIVQFIDPKKKRIGVGPRRRRRDEPLEEYSYLFFSYEQVEEASGRKVADAIVDERKRADRAEGFRGDPERVILPRVLPEGLKPYQLDTIDFVEKHGRVIVALEAGLGKTACAIVAIDPPAICVVPALLKTNWVREIAMWRPQLSTLLVEGSKHPPKELRNADVIVINYEIVEKHLEWLTQFGAKTLVADEAQALKTFGALYEPRERTYIPTEKTSNRARSFYELHWGIPKILFLTATPIMNRVKELWPMLHMANKQEWGNQKNFQIEYCAAREVNIKGRRVWDANGRSNTRDLHQRLVGRYMIRRTKAEVAKELPPKSRESLAVSMDLKHKKLYARVVRDFLNWIEEQGGPDALNRAGRAEALVRMTAMRRIAANGKAPAAIEWIQTHWESTQRPLVVMGVHRDALDKIAAGIDQLNAEREKALADGEMPEISKPIRYGHVVGGMSEKARQKSIDDFQKNGTLDLLLYSIKIATGTTLTRATEMLFIERLWRPADQVQAEDRVHRLTTTEPVQITYLDAEGTIDGKIAMLLQDKSVTAAAVIDGVDLSAREAADLVYGEMFGFDPERAYDPTEFEFADLIDDAAAGLITLEKEIAAEERELEENAPHPDHGWLDDLGHAEVEENPDDDPAQWNDLIDSSWNQPL